MGSGRWDPTDWAKHATTKSYATKTVDQIFAARTLDPSLDPKGANRESRDSVDNPNSTPLIIGLDVTGSMGMIADVMAKKGLNDALTEIYNRKPISDPHCMVMGIGDVLYDAAPLQVTQFEADLRIATQLEKLYLEHGGGGNRCESSAAAWYFAAHHIKTDAFEKRGKKGYLFTIGDEEPTRELPREKIEQFIGDTLQADVDLDALLTLVSRQWEVFHIMVAEGDHARREPEAVKELWREQLGQRAIWLTDHTKLAEVIVSTIQVIEGETVADVAKSWDGSTAIVVGSALQGLTKREAASGDLVTL